MRKFITFFLLILGLYVVVSFINNNGNPEIKEIKKMFHLREKKTYMNQSITNLVKKN